LTNACAFVYLTAASLRGTPGSEGRCGAGFYLYCTYTPAAWVPAYQAPAVIPLLSHPLVYDVHFVAFLPLPLIRVAVPVLQLHGLLRCRTPFFTARVAAPPAAHARGADAAVSVTRPFTTASSRTCHLYSAFSSRHRGAVFCWRDGSGRDGVPRCVPAYARMSARIPGRRTSYVVRFCVFGHSSLQFLLVRALAAVWVNS